MEIIFVVLGVVAVWMLWRMAGVQRVRAEVEAVRTVSEHNAREIDRVTRTLGTPEDAMRAGRLIEYYDQLCKSLGLDEDAVKSRLCYAENETWRRGLVEESLYRGVQCRLLDAHDYDRFVSETDFPGPEPTESMMLSCSAGCSDAMDVTLPPDAALCAFCGAPTKHILWKPETHAEHLAEWQRDSRAWGLWKRYKPETAAKQEAAAKAEAAEERDEEQAEFEEALTAFNAKGGLPKAAVVAATRSAPRPQACPACPQCRAPTAHIEEFDRWRCDRCNVYA